MPCHQVSTPSAGGCKLPTGVCLTTYEAAVHYVSEVPFSLALVPLFAIFNHFDRVIARISSEGGPAVGPSPQAIKVRRPYCAAQCLCGNSGPRCSHIPPCSSAGLRHGGSRGCGIWLLSSYHAQHPHSPDGLRRSTPRACHQGIVCPLMPGSMGTLGVAICIMAVS